MRSGDTTNPDRWLWEVGVDNEIYTSEATEEIIARDVRAFDDRMTYCALGDKDDESIVWCYGEPERRVVEVRLNRDYDRGPSFVLARRDSQDTTIVEVRSPEIVKVAAREVLTAADALDIILAFFRDQPFPPAYERVRKSYMFC
jgi:hypothetical protein